MTIQQRSATDTPHSTSGEPTEDLTGWTTLVANMPVSREDVSGTEQFRSDQQTAKFDTVFEMNYRADMDPDLVDVPKTRRLLLETRVFDIVACVEIGRRAGLRLQTLAGSRLT